MSPFIQNILHRRFNSCHCFDFFVHSLPVQKFNFCDPYERHTFLHWSRIKQYPQEFFKKTFRIFAIVHAHAYTNSIKMQNLVKVCAVVLVALVSSTIAFQCYVCNSKHDEGCTSPPREEYLKTCEDLKYSNHKSEAFSVCRLQVITSEKEGTFYDRRCGWIKHNENRETCLLTSE